MAKRSPAAASGSFNYPLAAGEGSYSFYTIATDNAGNAETTTTAQTTTNYDTTPPTVPALNSGSLAAFVSTGVVISSAVTDGGLGRRLRLLPTTATGRWRQSLCTPNIQIGSTQTTAISVLGRLEQHRHQRVPERPLVCTQGGRDRQRR